MSLLLRVLVGLVALAVAEPAAAEPTLYKGEYSLSFLGLTLARANFDSRIDEKSYEINGSVASAGLGAIFDDTRGTLSAVGRFSGSGARPELFRADYVSGKKASVVDIRFSDGNVTNVTIVPPPRKRGQDWLPLGPDDLLAVADPIAATLVQANSLDEVCNGTIKMFDSELRADLSLTFVSKGKASIQGYEGRHGDLPHEFQAGFRLSQEQTRAGLSEKREPHHGGVCPAGQNRHICADPRYGRHANRYDHGHGQAVRSCEVTALGASETNCCRRRAPP